MTSTPAAFPFRIRTITAFVCFTPVDFTTSVSEGIIHGAATTAEIKVSECATLLKIAKEAIENEGYEVQTVRIATNSFTEYLIPSEEDSKRRIEEFQRRLKMIDSSLKKEEIEFCSLGPAIHPDEVLEYCPTIIKSSHRFSCSVEIRSGNDILMARRTAECMKLVSKMGQDDPNAPPHVKNGLGNFRFCATACCKPCIPFFPGAKGPSLHSQSTTTTSSLPTNNDQRCVSFAIGLENGRLAQQLLSKAKCIDQISTVFSNGMVQALLPIQKICDCLPQPPPLEPTTLSAPKLSYKFLGFDTSLNPSLDVDGGSIASAVEMIDSVSTFGQRGTLAVASEITRALQSLPGIRSLGYSGLMLPVCEDRRLVELVRCGKLTTVHLLSVSGVCGVGLDTVPIKGCVGVDDLIGLILDVAGLAFRWDKQLSCRLLICPGKEVGQETELNSPYMCDCPVISA